MQKQETSMILPILVLVAFVVQGARAVRVLGAGPASGASGARLAQVLHGQPALLECRFQLDPDEALEGVTWTKDSHLVYRWLPGGRTTVVCKALIETEDSTAVNCTVGWRVTCSRVFPELNLTAGIFLPEQNKFFDQVSEWTKVVYSDNTYGFTSFKSYYVAEIPKSSIFLWSLSYKDQTPLATGNVSAGAVHESGCPDPDPVSLSPLLKVSVTGARPNCRGELAGAARASYSCANEIPHGHSTQLLSKELVCQDGQWIEEDPAVPWPNC